MCGPRLFRRRRQGRQRREELSAGDEVCGVADQARWGTHADMSRSTGGSRSQAQRHQSIDAGSLPSPAAASPASSQWARSSAGQRVLIHAGAGGVGSFAVPIAKQRGASAQRHRQQPTSNSCARSAPISQLTTPGAISPTRSGTRTWCSTWSATTALPIVSGAQTRRQDRSHFGAANDPGAAALRCRGEIRDREIRHRAAGRNREAGRDQGREIPCVGVVFAFGDVHKAYEYVMTGHARGRVMLNMRNGG